MSFIKLTRVLRYEGVRKTSVFSQDSTFIRIQCATICSKENRDPDYKRPEPWPYKTKKLTYLRSVLDRTSKRFDENTKVIVVDGNIGAGKSSLAKQLAEAFDMVYIPEPTMERYFVSAYGYDIRKIDDILPPSYKSCDVGTFYSNPHHQNVAKFQFRMFMFRYADYIDALAHVLNTGQGVVLERCVYSDSVFIEAMHKFGYISPRVLTLYNDIRKNTLEELLRPHLIIYLDITPEVALERIKKRNDPIEVNSKVLTKEYLATIDHFYKNKYLKELEKHAEVVVYDWSHYGDVEVVVEDIERIDFDKYTKYDTKMSDWQKDDDFTWGDYRRYYTGGKELLYSFALIFRPSVTEVFHPIEEEVEFRRIMLQIPGEKYAEGFNPAAGDNVLFKLDNNSFWKTCLRRID